MCVLNVAANRLPKWNKKQEVHFFCLPHIQNAYSRRMCNWTLKAKTHVYQTGEGKKRCQAGSQLWDSWIEKKKILWKYRYAFESTTYFKDFKVIWFFLKMNNPLFLRLITSHGDHWSMLWTKRHLKHTLQAWPYLADNVEKFYGPITRRTLTGRPVDIVQWIHRVNCIH
jgi:hypothetical protein